MITPDFIGQRYKDTNTGNIWIANSTTPGDWTLEVQNAKISWSPTTADFPDDMGYSIWENAPVMAGVTSLTLRSDVLERIDIESANDLVVLDCPNLTDMVGSSTGIYLVGFNALTTISFPVLANSTSINIGSAALLTTIDLHSLVTNLYNITVSICASLASLSLPNLVTSGDGFSILNNAALTTINVPLWVPTNGKQNIFTGCALNAATVNMLLARCVANAGFVSGKINTSGGTSAAPTGQGVTDKNTLNARLAGLAVTN